jgi:hypothetical protein
MIAVAFWLMAILPFLLWVGAAIYVVAEWLGLWEYRSFILLLYGCSALLYSVLCGISTLRGGNAPQQPPWTI